MDSDSTNIKFKANQLAMCTIAHLQPDLENIKIEGVCISKQEKRVIVKNSDKITCVLNLTIKDSSIDFINVACWGTSDFIDNLQEKINIAQTSIRILNPQVKLKLNGDNRIDEEFRPWTTSPFQLVVNEGNGSIEILHERIHSKYAELIPMPIREHNDFYTLEDIIAADKNAIDKEVNLLFLIRETGQPEEFMGKSGKPCHKLDMIIFDDTNSNFKLTIWDTELIKYALTWTPRVHVIFAIDLKINYNNYEKSLCALTTSKTIFTVNPNSKEGFKLYNYGKNVDLPPIVPILEQFKNKAIKCSIEELKNLFCQDLLTSEFVLLNAVISEFNMDDNFVNCFSLKCNQCNNKIDKISKRCYNRACKSVNGQYKKVFDITVSVSDHTSALRNVRVSAKLFEKIFGYSLDTIVSENRTLTNEQLTQLKWKVLLERWSMLIKITNHIVEEENQDSIKYYFKLINLEKFEEN